MERKEITCEPLEGFDFIIEESANASTNLRKISWNGRPHKLDLRKYTFIDGQERMLKGVTLSDEGADELTAVLVENGYGNTRRIISALRARGDFKESMLDPETKLEDEGEEQYYDPKMVIGGGGDDATD